ADGGQRAQDERGSAAVGQEHQTVNCRAGGVDQAAVGVGGGHHLGSHELARALAGRRELRVGHEAPALVPVEIRVVEAVVLVVLDGADEVAGVAHFSTKARSEEHTSELQSRENLVCRLLLEKKKKEKVKVSEVVV